MDVVDGMAHSVCVISTILDFVCFMYSDVDAIFFHGGRGGGANERAKIQTVLQSKISSRSELHQEKSRLLCQNHDG